MTDSVNILLHFTESLAIIEETAKINAKVFTYNVAG